MTKTGNIATKDGVKAIQLKSTPNIAEPMYELGSADLQPLSQEPLLQAEYQKLVVANNLRLLEKAKATALKKKSKLPPNAEESLKAAEYVKIQAEIEKMVPEAYIRRVADEILKQRDQLEWLFYRARIGNIYDNVGVLISPYTFQMVWDALYHHASKFVKLQYRPPSKFPLVTTPLNSRFGKLFKSETDLLTYRRTGIIPEYISEVILQRDYGKRVANIAKKKQLDDEEQAAYTLKREALQLKQS